jgi:putative heme iron utilization protein
LWLKPATAIRWAPLGQRLLVMCFLYRKMSLARPVNAIYPALREQPLLGGLQGFGFYRLQPLDIYYVGGFGAMGWVTAEDYRSAMIDPLADAAPGILEHMNSEHVSAMILLARVYAGFDATDATMTAINRLGFHLRMKTNDGMKGTRINFPREVQDSDEARKGLVEMVPAAEPKA